MSAHHDVGSLAASPNSLAAHYGRFRVGERLLLSGHSHQAWPDVALEGQIEAWTDAARDVDDKWDRASMMADRVRAGFARLLGTAAGEIALGASTHELLIRFLSSLDLDRRPKLVTTDGEFHTLRRQLDRLGETRWFEVVKLVAEPVETLAARLGEAVDPRTSAVFVSSVLFTSARIVPGLDALAAACRARGAELVIDAYHHLNVVPFSLRGVENAFVVGGGYKYCQLGEGNCFMRVPPPSNRYPVVTGWFSEFAKLSDRPEGRVPYGTGPARWAGATYDPTSHYRAARVFAFFDAEGLTPELLREVSQHQVARLTAAFDALKLDPGVLTRDRSTPIERVGGFLALTGPDAGTIAAALRARGVACDSRDVTLRLGPAPYLSDAQLESAIEVLGEVARA